MIVELSAHELTRTVLCAHASCPNEAPCRDHDVEGKPVRVVKAAKPSAYGRDEIIAAIQAWAATHGGAPPRSTDWVRASDDWPNMSTVARHFGKWSAAIAAAGFDPQHHQRKTWPLRAVAVAEREPEAAEATGVGPISVPAVSEASVPAPSPSRSATAPAKTGLIRMLARDVRRVADTLDAFVEAYEADLLEALEKEAA